MSSLLEITLFDLDSTVGTNDDEIAVGKYYAYGPAGCIDSRTGTVNGSFYNDTVTVT